MLNRNVSTENANAIGRALQGPESPTISTHNPPTMGVQMTRLRMGISSGMIMVRLLRFYSTTNQVSINNKPLIMAKA